MKNYLREYREKAKLSRRLLAEASGTTARAIRSWEEGTRELEKAAYISIRRMAEALGIATDELFENKPEEENHDAPQI